jgi:hypothetical protein
MVLGFAERYSFEKREDGVVVLMRQGAHGLRVGTLCAVVLFGSWWVGPYGPHSMAPPVPVLFYWLWSGFFGLVLFMSLFVVPFYRKDILITDDEVVVETVFYRSTSIKRIRRGRPLRLWIETIFEGGERPLFPLRVHFLDAGGRASGQFIDFQTRRGIEEMQRALQTAITLDVTDQKPLS